MSNFNLILQLKYSVLNDSAQGVLPVIYRFYCNQQLSLKIKFSVIHILPVLVSWLERYLLASELMEFDSFGMTQDEQ